MIGYLEQNDNQTSKIVLKNFKYVICFIKLDNIKLKLAVLYQKLKEGYMRNLGTSVGENKND